MELLVTAKGERMLVLSRKPDESILLKIGDVEARITLVEIRGGKARIGITAPQEVTILREELLNKKELHPV